MQGDSTIFKHLLPSLLGLQKLPVNDLALLGWAADHSNTDLGVISRMSDVSMNSAGADEVTQSKALFGLFSKLYLNVKVEHLTSAIDAAVVEREKQEWHAWRRVQRDQHRASRMEDDGFGERGKRCARSRSPILVSPRREQRDEQSAYRMGLGNFKERRRQYVKMRSPVRTNWTTEERQQYRPSREERSDLHQRRRRYDRSRSPMSGGWRRAQRDGWRKRLY